LQEGASTLRYTYEHIACLAVPNDDFSSQFWSIVHGNYSSGSDMFSLQGLPSVFDILARQAFSKIGFYGIKKALQNKKYSAVVVKQQNIKLSCVHGGKLQRHSKFH